MKYSGTSWEITYNNAYRLYVTAQDYDDITAKSRTLKQAWNAAFGLPDDYDGRDELLRDIDNYAYRCGIDLSKVSGY